MEWRIRHSSHDAWIAEKGLPIENQPCPWKPGNFMPGFIVYEASSFDTQEQAKRYIDRRIKEDA